MRTGLAAAAIVGMLGAGVVATPDSRPSGSLERPFPASGRVRMDLVAGDYQIVGDAAEGIRLDWTVRDVESLAKVKARVDIKDREASITTDGPSNRNLSFTIRVPRQSDLFVRLSAGDLRVEGIRGNKDVQLNAGDARIDVGRAEDYGAVDASVWVGDLKAEAFNVFKDGLFRSFEWHGKGPYKLHARLMAGDLQLYAGDSETVRARKP
jgi:hypothetical protein